MATFVIAMTINVNDQTVEIDPDQSSVAEIVTLLDIEIQGCAVALNGRVVPREQWEVTILSEGDTLLVIRATQGG